MLLKTSVKARLVAAACVIAVLVSVGCDIQPEDRWPEVMQAKHLKTIAEELTKIRVILEKKPLPAEKESGNK